MGNSCMTCSQKRKAPSNSSNTINWHSRMTAGEANTQTIDYKRITAKYKFSEQVLGTGNFGKVFLASSVADPDFQVAIKTLQKKRLVNEIDVLK